MNLSSARAQCALLLRKMHGRLRQDNNAREPGDDRRVFAPQPMFNVH